MAEKKLVMSFSVAGGGKTTMTLSNVQQDLDGEAVKQAMQTMCGANVFATGNGAGYSAPVAASYVEEVETELFNDAE